MSFKLNNFSVKKFNNDVNNCSNPDNKYKSWAQYRQRITTFIESAVRHCHAESIVVFGAGMLNDIDLHYIHDTFREAVLTDVDANSVRDGIRRQNFGKNTDRFEIVQSDYTGAAEYRLFESLESLADQAAPVDEIIAYIIEALRTMRGGEALKGRQFDVVFSCPVYTQLVYTQLEVFLKILYECGLYQYKELNMIVTAAHHYMSSLIKNYNDLLLSVLKESGIILVTTDIIEMVGDDKIKMVKKLIEQHDVKGIENLIQQNALDFAVTGRDDLLLKIRVLDTFYEIWPYDGTKEFLNLGISGKKPSKSV